MRFISVLPDYFTRNSHCHTIGRDVLRHHTINAYHCVLTDGDSLLDDTVSTDEYVVFYQNGLGWRCAWIFKMSVTIHDEAIGTHTHVVPYRDLFETPDRHAAEAATISY